MEGKYLKIKLSLLHIGLSLQLNRNFILLETRGLTLKVDRGIKEAFEIKWLILT